MTKTNLYDWINHEYVCLKKLNYESAWIADENVAFT